jgi:hypothetical protein
MVEAAYTYFIIFTQTNGGHADSYVASNKEARLAPPDDQRLGTIVAYL